jgi:hypothetical protein
MLLQGAAGNILNLMATLQREFHSKQQFLNLTATSILLIYRGIAVSFQRAT